MSLIKRARSAGRMVLISGLLAVACTAGLGWSSSRSVTGLVTDNSGRILKGAVVQLKNSITLDVRSYITQADGQYRFHGLRPDVDYGLKADYEGRSSRSRTLSQFDSKQEARIDLQVPTGKVTREQKLEPSLSQLHGVVYLKGSTSSRQRVSWRNPEYS